MLWRVVGKANSLIAIVKILKIVLAVAVCRRKAPQCLHRCLTSSRK